MLFDDRQQAGRKLAARVVEHARSLGPDPIVLALPRGGVPVGFEVARALAAPLEVFVVRKLGVPGQEELAMGAIASGGVVVLSDDIIAALAIPQPLIERVIAFERREVERRERAYRDHPPRPVVGRGAVVVDDGLATGATMQAAIAALRQLRPARITIAVPVASPGTCRDLCTGVDLAICAATPDPFFGVGAWYYDFAQTSDDEVRALLRAADAWAPLPAALHL
jgi:predicted phosphoribosyltransferase